MRLIAEIDDETCIYQSIEGVQIYFRRSISKFWDWRTNIVDITVD